MVSVIDARLKREHDTFRLRFACEDCAHYDPDAGRCSNGFPCEDHKDSKLAGRHQVTFCKAFELY